MAGGGTYNFQIDQAAVWDEEIQYIIDGEPVNLSQYTARLVAKIKASDIVNAVELTNGNGITLTADGYLLIHVPKETTRSYNWKQPIAYQLNLTPPNGDSFVFLKGTLQVITGLIK